MDSLMQDLVPGISFLVFEGSISKRSPFLEECCGRVFSAEVSAERDLKAPAENHGRTRVFFPPTIEIPVAVAAWTAKIPANLCVAVGHWKPSSQFEFLHRH